jgi:3-oxoacyl-[acyl-carrier protein] reductase
MSKLRGKVAVVTASKGIGAGVAKTLAAEGAAVVVNYALSRAGAMGVVDAITAGGGQAIAVKGDVSKSAEAGAIIEAAITAFGRLDILVNNAGIYEWAALSDITEAQYRRMFDTNVLGPLLVTQAAAKHLGEGAGVINIGSAVTARYPPATVVYTRSN